MTTRRDTWTCGAASPAPSYSAIVSSMSSMSCWISGARMASGDTDSATWRRTGCPSRATFRIAMSSCSRSPRGSQVLLFLRLHEAEDEAIARATSRACGGRRVVPVARVVRIAQETRLAVEREARRQDLVADDLLLDAMKRLHVGHACARAPAGIDDARHATPPERAEARPIHPRAVDVQPHGVVVEEHEEDGVQVAGLGWQRILELPVDAYDSGHRRACEARTPRRRGEPFEDEARVLAV